MSRLSRISTSLALAMAVIVAGLSTFGIVGIGTTPSGAASVARAVTAGSVGLAQSGLLAPTTTTTTTTTTSPVGTGNGAPSSSTAVAIDEPRPDDTVVGTQLQISGTAPPGVVVSVNIVDADTARHNIVHQPNGRIDGSVTSGSDGGWVFVPEVQIVPGQFDAQASYASGQHQTITSAKVPFVVVDASGQSQISILSWQWKIGFPLVVLALLGGGVWLWRRARRRSTGQMSQSHPMHVVHHTDTGVLSLWRTRRESERPELPTGPPDSTDAFGRRERRTRREWARPEAASLPSDMASDSELRHRSVQRTQTEPESRWDGGSLLEEEEASSDADSESLFMNTVAGKRFRREQAQKLSEQARRLSNMEDGMRGAQVALAASAEMLERSNDTINSLRHEISRGLATKASDPEHTPDDTE